MNKSDYTVVILTKNEGELIEGCIKKIPHGVDCFVLDSGSSDDTCEKAKNAGVEVVKHIMNPFIISDQRTWALKKLPIKTEWVLFLDADEVIPNVLHAEILKKINENKHNAFRMTPKYIFWGKWMKRLQGYPNWHDRLMKKDEVTIVGGVWEKFDDSANVGYIDVPYDHYANAKGFESWLEKHDRYSSWDANNTFKFLSGNNDIEEVRKKNLRRTAARLWWLRPWIRCLNMYFLRLGFLEGWQAFYLVMHYFLYEYMIVFKIIELKRKSKNEPL